MLVLNETFHQTLMREGYRYVHKIKKTSSPELGIFRTISPLLRVHINTNEQVLLSIFGYSYPT